MFGGPGHLLASIGPDIEVVGLFFLLFVFLLGLFKEDSLNGLSTEKLKKMYLPARLIRRFGRYDVNYNFSRSFLINYILNKDNKMF